MGGDVGVTCFNDSALSIEFLAIFSIFDFVAASVTSFLYNIVANTRLRMPLLSKYQPYTKIDQQKVLDQP